jgi:RHS repeat-associated protein
LNHFKFTDLEHDSESNLEHTWFRQLSSTHGRWLTPDPYMGSMDLTNPQSLNRYAYVQNNPLNMVDPLGLHICLLYVKHGDSETGYWWEGIFCGGGGGVGAPEQEPGHGGGGVGDTGTPPNVNKKKSAGRVARPSCINC